MSMVQEGGSVTPEYAWKVREGRDKRYDNKRVGGTVVVHFIKKNMWFLEAALALLDGERVTDAEVVVEVESQTAETAYANGGPRRIRGTDRRKSKDLETLLRGQTAGSFPPPPSKSTSSSSSRKHIRRLQ